MQNKVIIRYLDHKLLKGTTSDFFPHKQYMHLILNETKEVINVDIKTLKAIYFVKSFEGNPAYEEKTDIKRTGLGKRISVKFRDGEMLSGYTQGFSQERPGFHVIPADPDCNNERIFVNKAATVEIRLGNDIDEPEKKKGPEKTEEDDPMADELVTMTCPVCGVKNRLRSSKIMLEPKCGKCKQRLL